MNNVLANGTRTSAAANAALQGSRNTTIRSCVTTNASSMARDKLASPGGEALAMFADELSAHRYLERLLWPNGVCCPRCRGDRVGVLNGASTRLGTYKCYSCRKAFSLLHGTLMRSSHVPAHKWLQAIYLTEGGTRPMRPQHLRQILNVSSKTASSIMRRISEAADSQSPRTAAPSPGPSSPSLYAKSAHASCNTHRPVRANAMVPTNRQFCPRGNRQQEMPENGTSGRNSSARDLITFADANLR
jgi:transposase-like protein